MCEELLLAVKSHSAKDSSGYYHRQYEQYFNDLHASLAELIRTIKPKGWCVLVVQDSFYQDIPIPLAAIVHELVTSAGLQLVSSSSSAVSRNLIAMNSRARSARGEVEVSETVLSLQKTSSRRA